MSQLVCMWCGCYIISNICGSVTAEMQQENMHVQ